MLAPCSATRTVILTAVAMLAFAANALFGRMAMGEGLIDPTSYAAVRTISGAVALCLIAWPRWRVRGRNPADWRIALMLFTYMIFFAFAYLTMAAGTGALILFGAVQLTMFGAALRAGERFNALSWAGLAAAVGGLIYLVSPGLAAPDPLGAALMAISGVAWGFYSLLGKKAADPLDATANAFIFSVPLVIAVCLMFLGDLRATPTGLLLAIVSGAVTSACGYVIWYAALAGLTAGRAATVQLSVPAITAIGGVLMLSEEITARLVLASVATLGGVALVLAQRAAKPRRV
jgi:drug/metabolite transporter (DMT)-like permease